MDTKATRCARILVRAMSALILAYAQSSVHAASITVNTAVDEYGSGANCSLREAVESANGNANFGGCVASGVYSPAITDIVNLPELGGGAFTLTRFTGVHDDDNASTDIDIIGNLTINGFSAANTVIRGDTNDADADRDRIIHVISGNVILRNMTLRDGLVINQRAGGGLRTELDTNTRLVNVVVGLNTADGNAGGILNRGIMRLEDSVVSNNVTLNAVNGGGGIFSSGQMQNSLLEVVDSQIFGNRTEGSEHGNGAGIYASSPLVIDNSSIHDNVIALNSIAGVTTNGDGGGLYLAGTFTIDQSTISGNIANGHGVGSDFDAAGGGLFCAATASGTIRNSLITGNRVNKQFVTDGPSGGGMAVFCDLVLEDSVIDSNVSEDRSGGIQVIQGDVEIRRSTIVANSARIIGGASLAAAVRMEQSTIISNIAEETIGGLLVGFGSLHHLTIAGNIAGNPANDANSTGGLFLAGANADDVLVANSIIAGNTDGGNATDDCLNEGFFQGESLVQNATGCIGLRPGLDLINVQAELTAAANNGGPLAGSTVGPVVPRAMLTRMPRSTSRVIDALDLPCEDGLGAPVFNDQRGFARPIDGPDADSLASCDMGAVEFGGSAVMPDSLFANNFE